MAVVGGRLHLNHAAENVRCGVPVFVHLDAKLGAQVGHDDGGSADNKGTRD